jgi:hypothetical protein
MSSISDLRASREAAGQRFAAAVEELHQAFVDLAALDQALANGHVAGETLQTLGEPPDPWSLAHPRFAPHQPRWNWNTEVQAKRDEIIAAATA